MQVLQWCQGGGFIIAHLQADTFACYHTLSYSYLSAELGHPHPPPSPADDRLSLLGPRM